MLSRMRPFWVPVFAAGIFAVTLGVARAEDGVPWRVSKSSGDVWMTTSGAQPASLTSEAMLKPGDTIRTGQSGRVLLKRGEETMLIAPNSVISLPEGQKDGLSTTIFEQAGSVLIQAEKRNVKHFQVETPYLAAVVKGTQFRVSVDKSGGHVEVLEGRVEVADFKTGQFALVLPGQAAKVAAAGNGGLSLSGTGKFNPIEKGAPRAPSFDRMPVPKGGFARPADAPAGKTVHALGKIDAAPSFALADHDHGRGHNVLRITAPLGETTLNFVKATNGLAHGAVITQAERNTASQAALGNADSATNALASAHPQDASASNGNGNGLALGLGNGNGNGAGVGVGVGVGNGNGNGNGGGVGLGVGNGNGNGLALGLGNGNGNGLGLGLGNGNENGLALGHLKNKVKLKL